MHQVLLLKITSDHFLILPQGGDVVSVKRPFKFENMWFEVEGFCDLVSFFWCELRVSSSSSFILAKKLNFLKRRLKEWNKEVFGHLDSKMADLVVKIKSLDEKEQQLTLPLRDRMERLQMKRELSKVRSQIDMFWRQRAKQHWMEDGDRNTKFFHRVASMRRRFNAIDKIVVEGELLGDVASVKDAIVHFYAKLYHEEVSSRPFLEGISYNSIDEEAASEVVREFSEEEVWKAINELGKDKAPWPDGFNIAFFRHYWNVVKRDIMGLFADFHKNGVFEKSLNATFITLLPKVAGARISTILGLLV